MNGIIGLPASGNEESDRNYNNQIGYLLIHGIMAGDVHSSGSRPASMKDGEELKMALNYKNDAMTNLHVNRLIVHKAGQPVVGKEPDSPYCLFIQSVAEGIGDMIIAGFACFVNGKQNTY